MRRHRSKSAPRGRSPDPKVLKKAAKATKESLVTPPPRPKKEKTSSSEKVTPVTPRRISFGANTEHQIVAENPAPTGRREMNIERADEILKGLKDCAILVVCFQSLPPSLTNIPNIPNVSSRTREKAKLRRPNGTGTACIGNLLKYQEFSRKLLAFPNLLFANFEKIVSADQ